MAPTRVGARLARRLASAAAPPCALEPSPMSTRIFLVYGAPRRSLSSTAAATGEAEGATGAAAGATGAPKSCSSTAGLKPQPGDDYLLYGAPIYTKRCLSTSAGASGGKPRPGDAYLLYGAPIYTKRCLSTSAGASRGKPQPSDAYLLYGAPIYTKRGLSTSAGASGGKPGPTVAAPGAAGVTDPAAAATGGEASGPTGADPSSASVTQKLAMEEMMHSGGVASGAIGVSDATAATTGGMLSGAAGATGTAPGSTNASGVILKPLVKITTEDLIDEWKNSAGFRKALYIAASALIGGSVAAVSLTIFSIESRLSNKLTVVEGELKESLAAAHREDIERRNAAESKEAERREVAESKDKQRREDWARNIQLLVNDILSKIIKLEEKEWKNRHSVMQAEEILKRFGFSSDAESHIEVSKQFQLLQFQVDYLKTELSKEKETPVATELLQSIAFIDSQLTALKKRILELDIARGANSIQTGKGVTSDQSVKK